jgi:hypothetical protein
VRYLEEEDYACTPEQPTERVERLRDFIVDVGLVTRQDIAVRVCNDTRTNCLTSGSMRVEHVGSALRLTRTRPTPIGGWRTCRRAMP